jgi:hypothetical protein
MALQSGDIGDLMGRIQDAGSRGACASAGSFLDGARAMRAKPQNGSPRWRRLRSFLRRATIVLLAGLSSDVAHRETLPPTVFSTEIAPSLRSSDNAMAQNAAQDPGVERERPEPPRSAAPPRPEVLQPPHSVHKRRRVAPVTQVASDPATLLDSLDREIVQRYVRRNYGKIKHCWQLAEPTLAGMLETRFVILPSGTVDSVTAVGFDDGIAACVADVIKTISFPRSGAETDVRYPFRFVPR